MAQLNKQQKALAKLLLFDQCSTPGEVTTTLKKLFAGTIELMLEAGLNERLGYDKHDPAGRNSGNLRNGYGKKTISSEWGDSEIDMPRGRNGTFEPVTVAKRQMRTDGIEDRILAMCSKGMSTRDIEGHLRGIYGVEASASLAGRITFKIMPEVAD